MVLSENGYTVLNNTYFDTLTIKSDSPRPSFGSGAAKAMVYFSETEDDLITLSLNETTTVEKLEEIASLLCGNNIKLVSPFPTPLTTVGPSSRIKSRQSRRNTIIVTTHYKVLATTSVQFVPL